MSPQLRRFESVAAVDPRQVDHLAAQLLDEFLRMGVMILIDHEVEAEGVHRSHRIPHKTLAPWRTQREGPPHRTRGRIAWYQIEGLARWTLERNAAGRSYRAFDAEPGDDPQP
ncbi:MAG: hypothetical protein ABIQ86_12790 [Steroidobacteraceae bacterium]